MVHVGPVRSAGGGIVGDIYRLPHGRASILFVVVAGVGVSLLASRPGARDRETGARLLWRAALLLPLGLALQELDTGVAVILQYYALYFVIALATLRVSSRGLLGLIALMSGVGPLLVLVARRLEPEWFGAIPAWSEPWAVGRDLLVSGTYPAAVWVVPLLIGVLVGRLELSSPRLAGQLVLAGSLLAAAAYGVRSGVEGLAGAAPGRADWWQLALIEPHNEMPLWVLSSSGVAVAAVGCAVLVASAARRLSWPVVALGQLALSVYVAHLLVLWQRPEWLRSDLFPEAWERVGIFLVVAVALALIWRARFRRGPLEATFAAPWTLIERRRRGGTSAAAPAGLESPASTAP